MLARDVIRETVVLVVPSNGSAAWERHNNTVCDRAQCKAFVCKAKEISCTQKKYKRTELLG